jgi:putative transposase
VPKHRVSTPEFKLKVVREVISGKRSAGKIFRTEKLSPNLVRTWRDEFESAAPNGYRRITKMLHRSGHQINKKALRHLMGTLGILQKPHKRVIRTTNSNHEYPRYPNLVKDLVPTHPDHYWVADITYIRLRTQWIYLAVIMDVFTRMFRGWAISRTCDRWMCIEALQMALDSGHCPQIHHSDQGVQYASGEYTAILKDKLVSISMAKVGEPRENGFAERVIRTIKDEHVSLTEYDDYDDVLMQIPNFLGDVEATKRIHSSLSYLTPAEFEELWIPQHVGAQELQNER